MVADLQTRSQTSRRAMIDCQLRPSGVTTPHVVAAIEAVAREDFVPEDKRGHAYMDRTIAVPGGLLSAPLVHGKMLEEAMPRVGENVLVIENGNGYLAALITAMGANVTAEPAEKIGKGGTFDCIVIDGAAEELPKGLGKRLAPEGRLITGVVERGVTRLARGRMAAGSLSMLSVADLDMPKLAAFARKKSWSF